jgi:L-threonylcarbamoyladenylate synthase
METIHLSHDNIPEAAEKAAAVIDRGGVVLYPTDTLYGLGADASRDDAVRTLYAIKGRPEGKPIHALVADAAMAARFGELTPAARALIYAIEDPVSIIVKKQGRASGGIFRSLDTFGFRIASHPFCVALVRACGRPVTTTSANRAGTLPYRSVPEILEQLGAAAAGIDLVIDAGQLPQREASSIVDLSGAEPIILREGAVPAARIIAALSKGAV